MFIFRVKLQYRNQSIQKTQPVLYRWHTSNELAGRRLVWDWQSTHNIHLERFRWLSLTSKDIQWSLIIDKHYELFEALKNRDTDEANYLTAAHLHKMLHDLQYLLDLYPNYFIQSTAEE